MLAAERYKSVWNMFLQALNHNPTACLRAFQCEQHVNKRSMARWMRNNGLSVRKAKTLLHESKKSADKQMPPSDSMFLPITADFTLSHKETSDMLYGVCFTFPDGTQVNIKRGTAEAVISFLKLYQRRALKKSPIPYKQLDNRWVNSCICQYFFVSLHKPKSVIRKSFLSFSNDRHQKNSFVYA